MLDGSLITPEIESFAKQESQRANAWIRPAKVTAGSIMLLGEKVLSESINDTPNGYASRETHIFHDFFEDKCFAFGFHWYEFRAHNALIKVLLGSQVNNWDDGNQCHGAYYVDIDASCFAEDKIPLSKGAIAWILAGGIWLVPSLISVEGRSEGVDNIIGAIKAFPNKVNKFFVGGSGNNANLAVRVALSEPGICDALLLRNGAYDNETPNRNSVEGYYAISEEEPCNPSGLNENILYLATLAATKTVHDVGLKDNHLLSLCDELTPSILDDKTALAFLIRNAML